MCDSNTVSRSRSKSRDQKTAWILANNLYKELSMRLLLSFPLQKTGDGAGHTLPVLGFRDELFLACLRDGVEPGLAIVLRYAPLGLDPLLLHQAAGRQKKCIIH